MLKTGKFFSLLVLFLFVAFLLSFIDGRRLEPRSGLQNRLSGERETSLPEEKVNPVDQLHAPCTDCKEKDVHSVHHKIRHAHNKKLRNARNFNENQQNMSPTSSGTSNVSPNDATPLQILFRTYVNGFKTAEWLSHQKDNTKLEKLKEETMVSTYSHKTGSANSKPDVPNLVIVNQKPEVGFDDIIDIDADPENQVEDDRHDGSDTRSDTFVDDDPKTSVMKDGQTHRQDKIQVKHEEKGLSKGDKVQPTTKPSDTATSLNKHDKKHRNHDKKHRNHKKKEKSKQAKKTHSLNQIIKAFQREDSLRFGSGKGQKLFNQLQEPMRSLIHYMEQLDRKVLARSRETSLMSESMFNSTRYVMMIGAREIIQDVIKVNNGIYKIVVDASDLTRDIYRRSHKRQDSITPLEPLKHVSTMGVNNGIKFHDISEDFQKVQELYNKVKMMKMKSQQVSDRVLQIKEKLELNRGRDELKDLIYHANQTSAKLEAEFRTSLAIRKYDRYRNAITDINLLIQEASLLAKKGREEIMESTKNTRSNMMFQKDMKKRRRRKRQINSPSTFTYSSTERAKLLPVIRQASNHAKRLQESAAQIKRTFEPLIYEANNLERFSSRGDGSSARYLPTEIISTVKNIYHNLNGIRDHIEFRARLPIYCIFSNNSDYNCIGEVKEEEGCTEGSTCDLIDEGSASDLDGANPNTDNEFEFVEYNDTSVTGQLPSSEFNEFGVHLKNRIKIMSEKNQRTLILAKNISQTVKDKARGWNLTKQKLESTVYKIKQTSDFRNSWHQHKANFSRISDKVSVLSTSLATSIESTQSKCRLALDKSDNMVKLIQAISDGSSNNEEDIEGSADGENNFDDDDDDDSDGEGGIDVSTVSDKVQKTKKELNTLNQIRQETPILCENIQDKISKMRSAISSLKEKVNRARLVMSSMQLPVIINDTSYIQSEIEDRSGYPSMVTEIEVCMKPATENGVVLMVVGNNSDSYMLEMKDGLLQLILKDVNKDEKAKLSADEALDLNKWYTVKIKRVGQTMIMWVNTTDGENRNKLTSTTETQFYQSDPGAVYIGGAPANVLSSGFFATDDFSWKGCVSGLMINGKIVSTYLENHQKENPKPCKTNCHPLSNKEPSMRFSGNGHVEFPAKYFYRHPVVTSVSIEFRTGQKNAFIMSIHHSGERFQLEVTILNGNLVIKTTTPSESILLRTMKTFNDNILHTIKISYRDSTTYPEVDGVDELFSIYRQPGMNNKRDGILLGGVPTLSLYGEKSSYFPPNLIGCLRNLTINEKRIGTFEMTAYENVHIGSCQAHNIWGNCVKFDDGSHAIEMLNKTKIKLLNLNIGRDSMGQLLQYEKTSKFNLTLEVKDGVVYIKEDVKGFTADIVFPPNITFIPIVIQDVDSKSLVITILNEERTISYSSGGGWWFQAGDDDDDDEIIYNIKLGLRSGDPVQPFRGDVAEFAVNSELQNLRSNSFRENMLTSCIRKDSKTLIKSKHIQFESCR